jgi:hypothetical protein
MKQYYLDDKRKFRKMNRFIEWCDKRTVLEAVLIGTVTGLLLIIIILNYILNYYIELTT